MSTQNDNLYSLCELLLMEERAPEALMDPDEKESKDYLAAIKWKKGRLVEKIISKSPGLEQSQVDKCNSEYKNNISRQRNEWLSSTITDSDSDTGESREKT